MDNAFENDHGPHKIVGNAKLVKSLSRHSTLRNLSIMFELGYLDDETHAVESCIPLGGFTNLTSLSLLNFYGRFGHDRLSVATEIAELLRRCQSLKSLSLGVACDCDCDSLPEAVLMKPLDNPFLRGM